MSDVWLGWHVVQSNLAPGTTAQFDPPRNTCWGDVIFSTPGILIIVHWTKTFQCVGNIPLLHIPSMPGHAADPVAAYKQLLEASPTKAAYQPLLTFVRKGQVQMVTVTLLARAFWLMLQALAWTRGCISFTVSTEGVPQPPIGQEVIIWI